MRTAPLSQHHPRRDGLTLVEVLVSLLVLSAGALTTIGTQVAIARLSATSLTRDRTGATAASILDSLRAQPCAHLASGATGNPDAHFSWNVSTIGDLGTLRLDVTPAQGTPWSAETLVPCV